MLIKWPLESKQADENKQKIVMNEELLYGSSNWSRKCINIWNNKHITILWDVSSHKSADEELSPKLNC